MLAPHLQMQTLFNIHRWQTQTIALSFVCTRKRKEARMTDIERLRHWMADKNIKTKPLAREMGMPYLTLYTILERRGRPTYGLVTSFTKRYGSDTARAIFQEYLAPLEVA
jgi:hypothetical protein